jgi:hypothetical protein
MRRTSFQPGLFTLYLAIGAALLGVVLIWFHVDRRSLALQLREDAPIESATALLALVSCALSATAAWRSSRPVAWIMLASLGLFTAGEEVTWGRGLLWEGHTRILGVYVDNAHDFFDVFLKSVSLYAAKSQITGWFLLAVAGAAGGGTLVFQRLLTVRPEELPLLWSPPARFAYLAFVLALLSQLIDNRVFNPFGLTELVKRAIEEPMEFMSALALVFAPLSHRRYQRGHG